MSFVKYDVLKGIAKHYGLHNRTDIKMFDDLWEVYQVGNKFRKDNEDRIHDAIRDAYTTLTDIVAGRRHSGSHGFRRVAETRDDKLVIFSDHHMTHRGHRHDYFFDFNYPTYLEVLRRYAGDGFSLVEDGDVEELIVFEPTREETRRRRKLVHRPLLVDDIGRIDWDELVGYRLETRRDQLERIITDNQDYYDTIKEEFGRGRYYKISGNHDTYDSGGLERMIESVYWEGVVKDILLVNRKVHSPVHRTHVVPFFAITHGHQFDEACIPPFATQIGETISECLSWGFQGADRIWTTKDDHQWVDGPHRVFNNALAGSNPARVPSGHPDLEWMLEGLMGHEVAWEYFDNSNPYLAFVREVCTGDEFFKYRHMNENELVNAILAPWNELEVFPTLVCGHTHEPRLRSKFTKHSFPRWLPPALVGNRTVPDTNDQTIFTKYVNSGSAGRFENLIWCAEISGNEIGICSWSNTGTKDNVRLQKVRWNSDGDGHLHGTEVEI